MRNLAAKTALTLSAITFFAIGSLIVFAPAFLFAMNGMVLDPAPAMMSEVRAPGILVLLGGLVATAGLVNKTLERPALLASAALLLAYGIGRLISLPLDGLPPASLQAAAAVELGLGAWCAVLARRAGLPTFQTA
ncbi:DUF4345 domain-containing protein [Roseibium sp. Sym1]|uniref:DUF4345 domain-containing protein n=1 Tax=Roseibium sp. Sym1 TaxID=3016006 RepID=UPI0022B523D2|nr:DUF4345 domain-containing protein [Roseibium sp. Sym1]